MTSSPAIFNKVQVEPFKNFLWALCNYAIASTELYYIGNRCLGILMDWRAANGLRYGPIMSLANNAVWIVCKFHPSSLIIGGVFVISLYPLFAARSDRSMKWLLWVTRIYFVLVSIYSVAVIYGYIVGMPSLSEFCTHIWSGRR